VSIEPAPNAPPPVITDPSPGAAGSPPAAPAGPWGLWTTLGFTAAVAGAFVFVQAVVLMVWVAAGAASGRHLTMQGLETNGLVLALASCASAPVAIALTCLFAGLRRGMPVADYLALRPASLRGLVPWTIALLVLAALSDVLTVSLGRPIVPDFMVQVYRTAGVLPLLALAIVVVLPLAEEVLFRGFLFTGVLHSRLGPVGAVVLTALLWSLMHVQYDAYGIGTIFVSGLLLGYARLKTGSLYVTILLHGLMNLLATIEVLIVLRGTHPGG
jgi:membrane protease YdiL (CAAX protease family)